jgi:hypothetical protein
LVPAVNVYISDHLAESIRIRDLAASLGLSRSHFSRNFRKLTGQSPQQYVTRTRLKQARVLLRNRSLNVKLPQIRKEPVQQAAYPEYPTTAEETPLAQFMTTYQSGNDLYDDSFSIDSQSGEFLGECGVGISETIGVGDPKKVTAFEVWLFDKNDIQTVTKGLMSRHAFNDETIRQRLAAKGEPVPADPGHEMVLETATLRLTARVVDMSYGMGALPPESYFERMTLELVAWSKV